MYLTLETGITIVAVILYIILLSFSVYMIISFYVCDDQNCKPFKQANSVAPQNTKDNVLALLNELNNDGIWPLAFIGSSLITALGLWFIQANITIRTYIIMFLTGFMVIYFLFTFVGHHYLRPVADYVSEYIENTCISPASPLNLNNHDDMVNFNKTHET